MEQAVPLGLTNSCIVNRSKKQAKNRLWRRLRADISPENRRGKTAGQVIRQQRCQQAPTLLYAACRSRLFADTQQLVSLVIPAVNAVSNMQVGSVQKTVPTETGRAMV